MLRLYMTVLYTDGTFMHSTSLLHYCDSTLLSFQKPTYTSICKSNPIEMCPGLNHIAWR